MNDIDFYLVQEGGRIYKGRFMSGGEGTNQQGADGSDNNQENTVIELKLIYEREGKTEREKKTHSQIT